MESLMEMRRKDDVICDAGITKDLQCMTNLIMGNESVFDVTDQVCGDKCYPQCQENTYKVTMSSTVWPSDKFWPWIADEYNVTFQGKKITEAGLLEAEVKRGIANSQESVAIIDTIEHIKVILIAVMDYLYITDLFTLQALVQKNFLRVQVYFTTKSVTSVREDPEYDFITLLTSLGGAFSLCLGMSLISLFEFFELSVACVARRVAKP